jgi:hypothetical protein
VEETARSRAGWHRRTRHVCLSTGSASAPDTDTDTEADADAVSVTAAEFRVDDAGNPAVSTLTKTRLVQPDWDVLGEE